MSGTTDSGPKNNGYKETLLKLQIELVKLQHHVIAEDLKILLLFEGRDAAGKDGVIKRITQHMSPRETRVVALGKPTARENRSWYLQRYVQHLPASQEMVLFNRSWYNRAGVERVMGFCTEEECETFFQTIIPFERILVEDGIQIHKYYLDITRDEQEKRLEDRRINPLKQWKISPIDAVALEYWQDYSKARDDMLARTHNDLTPWHVVKTDSKKQARLNVIRHLLSHVDYPEKNPDILLPDQQIVFAYHTGAQLA